MKVGIVVTGFFCGNYLVETISSLKAQRDTNWTCAIVYDPDEHGPLASSLIEGDCRFKLVPSQPVNVCAARNLGYSQIGGDLLFALDGDDLIAPTYISILRKIMQRDEVAIAYTGTKYFGELNETKAEYPYSFRSLAIRNPIVAAAMIRRRDFYAVGGYDEELADAYEDWELWIGIVKRGGEVAFHSEPLFHYRQHSRSRSRCTSYRKATAAKEYIFTKHKDFCWHTPNPY